MLLSGEIPAVYSIQIFIVIIAFGASKSQWDCARVDDIVREWTLDAAGGRAGHRRFPARRWGRSVQEFSFGGAPGDGASAAKSHKITVKFCVQ